jgi:hypothetical protein
MFSSLKDSEKAIEISIYTLKSICLIFEFYLVNQSLPSQQRQQWNGKPDPDEQQNTPIFGFRSTQLSESTENSPILQFRIFLDKNPLFPNNNI